MSITTLVDNSIYPKAVILEARAAFSEYLTCKIEPHNRSRKIRITVSALPKYMDDEKEIFLSFMNFVLDLTIKHVRSKGDD